MELREVVARAISRRHGYGEFITSLADSDAALQAIQDAGYAIVPVEPTEEMIDRFVSRALMVSIHGEGGWSEYGRNQYKTMIAAFPTSPPSASDGECNRSDSKESA